MFSQTQTTGSVLLFWTVGAIYAAAGVTLYCEYGLTVPRRVIKFEQSDGTAEHHEIGVPRSGGELHYVRVVLLRAFQRLIFPVRVSIPKAGISQSHSAVHQQLIRNLLPFLWYNGS